MEIRNDLAGVGVKISDSLMRRRLLASRRKEKRSSKKQLLTSGIKKRVARPRKYKNCTENQWKNVLFSDESHFMVLGQQKRFVRTHGKMVTEQHIH